MSVKNGFYRKRRKKKIKREQKIAVKEGSQAAGRLASELSHWGKWGLGESLPRLPDARLQPAPLEVRSTRQIAPSGFVNPTIINAPPFVFVSSFKNQPVSVLSVIFTSFLAVCLSALAPRMLQIGQRIHHCRHSKTRSYYLLQAMGCMMTPGRYLQDPPYYPHETLCCLL